MIDLAENQGDRYVPLKEIAKRQEVSEKYLEIILKTLVRENLLVGLRGKGGGYRLSYAPEQYTVGSILRLTEGNLAPVACLETEENLCQRCGECPTLDFWTGLYAVVNDYIDRYTLADLLEEQQRKRK